MINKKELIEFIDKYSLGGIIEKARWIVDDENHTIFVGSTSENSNIDVEVVLKDNFNIQSLSVVFASTLTLKRMLNVLSDDIKSIEPKFRGDFVTKLTFDDGLSTISCIGYDKAIIKEYIPIKHTGDKVLSIKLKEEFISRYLKVKSAMTGQESFKIVNIDGKIILSIGYSDRNTDRININIETEIDNIPEDYPISFNAEYLKQILTNNNGEAILDIYCKDGDKYIGIIRYSTDLFECKYILYQRIENDEI